MNKKIIIIGNEDQANNFADVFNVKPAQIEVVKPIIFHSCLIENMSAKHREEIEMGLRRNPENMEKQNISKNSKQIAEEIARLFGLYHISNIFIYPHTVTNTVMREVKSLAEKHATDFYDDVSVHRRDSRFTKVEQRLKDFFF